MYKTTSTKDYTKQYTMITTKATKASSLGGVIAKRAAVVRQRTAWQQQGNNHERSLTTLANSNHLFGGRIHDSNNDNNNTNEHSRKMLQQTLHLQQTDRLYHTTPSAERAPAIFMGLATVSALGFAGSSAIKSYNEYKASLPTEEEMAEIRKEEKAESAKFQAKEEARQKQEEKEEAEKPRTNVFREWFDVGTKYYEGGFEETMTKREAALILGVRESSSPARVKDAHRRLLILNHPDTGGSTFLAGKLNEAKELLLKGKSQKKK